MYWGKIIGTVVGVATLKPWFVVLGLILGHQFDRGFASRYRQFEENGERVGRLTDDYIKPLFQVIGHIAKSDGRVTQEEIRASRSIMHRLGLTPAQVRKAIGWFDDGKQRAFPLEQTVRQMRREAARRAEQRQLFVRLLLEVALARDGVHNNERALIWQVCTLLDIGRVEFAQLEAMIRAQKGFRQSPAGNADSQRLQQAYRTLGVDASSTNDDVKRAYRRLINKSHPDKIAANNPDADQLADAQRRTREVRSAYEMLKARRSIR